MRIMPSLAAALSVTALLACDAVIPKPSEERPARLADLNISDELTFKTVQRFAVTLDTSELRAAVTDLEAKTVELRKQDGAVVYRGGIAPLEHGFGLPLPIHVEALEVVVLDAAGQVLASRLAAVSEGGVR